MFKSKRYHMEMTCCRRAASRNSFIVRPLDGAFKRKTANEAKRNGTETGHEANKGNDRQATEHDNTKRNETRRNEGSSAHSKAAGGERGGGRGRGGGGREGERAGAGKLWPRVGGTSHMIP